MDRFFYAVLVVILASTQGCGKEQKSDRLAVVQRAVDGDTIALEGGEKVRYIGIDAPETVHPEKPVQCWGPESSLFNKSLVEGKTVSLKFDVERTDMYGRTLAYVYLEDGLFVNAELVRTGNAISHPFEPNLAYTSLFKSLEKEAKKSGAGLWGSCEK